MLPLLQNHLKMYHATLSTDTLIHRQLHHQRPTLALFSDISIIQLHFMHRQVSVSCGLLLLSYP